MTDDSFDTARPPVLEESSTNRTYAGWMVGVLALVAAVACVALRMLYSAHSVDIFIDEATYLKVSQSVSHGHFPTLYNLPFVFHPGFYFAVAGGLLNLVRISGPLVNQILELRWLSAVCSGLLVLVATALTWRAMSRTRAIRAAITAASFTMLLFCVDPYLERFGSRVLLEPLAQPLIFLGWFFALGMLLEREGHAAATHADRRALRRASNWLPAAVLTGLFFGLAITTKEVAFFSTIVPLAIGSIKRLKLFTKRFSLTAILTAIAVYGCYVGWVVASGSLHKLWIAYHNLFKRSFGLEQITGFNSAHAPRISAVLAGNLRLDGPSYLLVALGGLAALWLLWRRQGAQRALGLYTTCAMAYFAFSALGGAFEEQLAFFALAPALLCLALVLGNLVVSTPSRLFIVAPLILAITMISLAFSLNQRTLTDNTHARLEAYMLRHYDNGGVIAVTSDSDFYVANDIDHGRTVPLRHLADIKHFHVSYVIIETKLTNQGYAFIGPEIYRWLKHNATLVVSYKGYSAGELRLYKVKNTKPADPLAGFDWSKWLPSIQISPTATSSTPATSSTTSTSPATTSTTPAPAAAH